MSNISPTRSAVLELQDERRAMHEGYVFLDEKCLLLAGEILRQLQQHAALQRRMDRLQDDARTSLQAAISRHGLQELQILPPADGSPWNLQAPTRSLMGVKLQEAALSGAAEDADTAINASPEAQACGQAFAAVLSAAVPLAAVVGNLERLGAEYMRSVRRARALQDVMLPELERSIGDIEGRLEELEQEDAVWMRHGQDTYAP